MIIELLQKFEHQEIRDKLGHKISFDEYKKNYVEPDVIKKFKSSHKNG